MVFESVLLGAIGGVIVCLVVGMPILKKAREARKEAFDALEKAKSINRETTKMMLIQEKIRKKANSSKTKRNRKFIPTPPPRRDDDTSSSSELPYAAIAGLGAASGYCFGSHDDSGGDSSSYQDTSSSDCDFSCGDCGSGGDC